MSNLIQKVPQKNLKLLLSYAKLLYGVVFLLLCLETGLWFYKGVKPTVCQSQISETHVALIVPNTLDKHITHLNQLAYLTTRSNCGFKLGYLWLGILFPLCLVFCPKDEGDNID